MAQDAGYYGANLLLAADRSGKSGKSGKSGSSKSGSSKSDRASSGGKSGSRAERSSRTERATRTERSTSSERSGSARSDSSRGERATASGQRSKREQATTGGNRAERRAAERAARSAALSSSRQQRAAASAAAGAAAAAASSAAADTADTTDTTTPEAAGPDTSTPGSADPDGAGAGTGNSGSDGSTPGEGGGSDTGGADTGGSGAGGSDGGDVSTEVDGPTPSTPQEPSDNGGTGGDSGGETGGETGGGTDVGSGADPDGNDAGNGGVDQPPTQVDGPTPTTPGGTDVVDTPSAPSEPESPAGSGGSTDTPGATPSPSTPGSTDNAGTPATPGTPSGTPTTPGQAVARGPPPASHGGGSDSQGGGVSPTPPTSVDPGTPTTPGTVVETPRTEPEAPAVDTATGVEPTAPEGSGGSVPPTANNETGGHKDGVASGSAGQPTRPGNAGQQPNIIDLVKHIFSGGSGGASAERPAATNSEAAAPAAPATAPVAAITQPVVTTAPAVVEEVVEPAATAKATRQVEVEPRAAATAPRIRYSSGGDREDFRRHELTALGLTPHARQVLGALGFRTLSEHRSALLGNRVVARIRTPGNQSAEAALARARSVLPDVIFDYSHLYRPSGEQTPVRYAAKMIGAPLGETCAVPARVGLIDSGVGTHATLDGAKITRKNFVEKGVATNVAHGTAIASILVGDLPGTGPLMPGAQLFSANVFAQDKASGLRADATAIIAALDWMAAQRVPVVNLSLMGPSNELLERAVQAAAARGLVMVAAAGNDGPNAGPAYPAAYPAVIAVSAVDARGRPYGNNNRGSYIYVAAPGVDIWGADARGGLAFWTGTSFAAPFVTASLARDVALGRAHGINDGRARLASSARDLGAPGRDPIYGFGLLQAGGCGAAGNRVLSSKN